LEERKAAIPYEIPQAVELTEPVPALDPESSCPQTPAAQV
jgi:hypothetical protein